MQGKSNFVRIFLYVCFRVCAYTYIHVYTYSRIYRRCLPSWYISACMYAWMHLYLHAFDLAGCQSTRIHACMNKDDAYMCAWTKIHTHWHPHVYPLFLHSLLYGFVHLFCSSFSLPFCISISSDSRPRIEKSHFGCPRTVSCVVKYGSQQQNESIDKNQWYNMMILLHLVCSFKGSLWETKTYGLSNLSNSPSTTCQYARAASRGALAPEPPRATGVRPESARIIASPPFPLFSPFSTFFEIGHLLVL